MSDFIKGLWPRNLSNWLGLILGALSVLKLMEFGFKFGFGMTFTLLLTYYETLVHIVFGWWAEPIIKAWLADLAGYLSWDLHLHPHWKHIFLLMGVYFFRDAGNSFRNVERGGPPLYFTGAFELALGLVVGLASSIGAGVVAISQSEMHSNFLIAAIPIAGVAVYDVVTAAWYATWLRRIDGRWKETWSGSFIRESLQAAIRASVGVLIIVVGLQLPEVRQLASPGIAMLGMFVFVLALWWLLEGVRKTNASVSDRNFWFREFWHTGEAPLGAAMLGVFFWVGVLVAANAGLRFYGL